MSHFHIQIETRYQCGHPARPIEQKVDCDDTIQCEAIMALSMEQYICIPTICSLCEARARSCPGNQQCDRPTPQLRSTFHLPQQTQVICPWDDDTPHPFEDEAGSMENARRVMKTSQALQAALIAPHVDSTTTPLSHQRLEKEQPQASTIG